MLIKIVWDVLVYQVDIKMGLLNLIGFGSKEKLIEKDKDYFQKYVDSLSSQELENLKYVLSLKELDKILDETRFRLNVKNRMRVSGIYGRY